MKTKALFLDRDGVINQDFGYVSEVKNFIFCDGIFKALRGFIALKYKIFIVTNQSGIARGYYTLKDFFNLSEFMIEEFKKEDIFIDKIYFCPHDESAKCSCRKPKAGMILQALNEFEIDLQNSILIGDKLSDILAAKAANVGRSFLIPKDTKSVLEVLEIVKKENNEQ